MAKDTATKTEVKDIILEFIKRKYLQRAGFVGVKIEERIDGNVMWLGVQMQGRGTLLDLTDRAGQAIKDLEELEDG